MRTLLSTRRQRFQALTRAAFEQSSEWLASSLRDRTRNNGRMSPLARLACLRVLIWRNFGLNGASGLPYPQRKQAVRAALGV